ncbi:SDR family oxidoreductase [Phanerochaete sordida]|uniref:SDR family oxidoreductase n=1 Tax=Phanerochaete sordida TaxID=48140 RepID=A0A9P3LEL5_9APHY|nr:SDR family oxidoreductase [Phanerochaete sordida]
MSSPRVWFVTGSSTGFGRNVVELALAKGDKVVATLRTPSDLDDLRAQFPPSQLHILALDVTQPAAITAAFASAKAAFGRIDVVFNNAGISPFAEVEGTPDAVARATFEVNFWGAANVSREAVRFFREENTPAGGVLLNLSSIVGVQALPVMGYYSASKHAFDGLTQSLAAELDPKWNIKVILILPSFFRTPIKAKSGAEPQHPAYAATTTGVRSFVDAVFAPDSKARIGDPRKAAQKIYEASTLAEPPFRLFLGDAAVAEGRRKIASLSKDLEAYAAWSEEVMEDQ